MGFRVQKSFRVAKGVRINVSKTGVGMSVGTRGARYSAHSSGRTTRTVGIPGSGLRYQDTRGRGGARSSRRAPSAPVPSPGVPRKPGLLAPKSEKALYRAIADRDSSAIARVGDEFEDVRSVAFSLGAFMIASANPEEAERMLEAVFVSGNDPQRNTFAENYLPATQVHVEIARGVSALLPLSRDAVGLLLAEIKQEKGLLGEAISVVERLDANTYTAVSLVELYSQAQRYVDVVELTENIRNEDDATALLCVFRGEALHEQGFSDAALTAFKEALKSKSRAKEIRHLALSERARTYEAIGKNAMARKDLERILAEDSTYEGLRDRIAALGASSPKRPSQPAIPTDTDPERASAREASAVTAEPDQAAGPTETEEESAPVARIVTPEQPVEAVVPPPLPPASAIVSGLSERPPPLPGGAIASCRSCGRETPLSAQQLQLLVWTCSTCGTSNPTARG